MTRRLLAALLLWLLASLPAAAQMMPVGAFPQGGTGCGHGGYCGPGDIISFDAYFSCTRGYSFAFAQPGTNKACLLRKAISGTFDTAISDCDLLIRPDGTVDLTITPNCDSGTKTVDQWGASRTEVTPTATGTGSAAGTILTITGGCTNSFIPDMQISGLVYITSNGTGTGCAGTYNLSGSLTLGAGTRTGTPPTIRVQTFYDQTGNGWDATLVGANNPSRYAWGGTTPGCVDAAFPCAYQSTTSPSDTWIYESAGNMSPASPMGLTLVGAQVAGSNIGVTCGGWLSSSSRQNAISSGVGNRSIVSLAVVSVSDNATHAANASLNNTGPLATINVDGTTDTDSSSTTEVNFTSAPVRIFGRAGQDQFDLNETGCKNGGTIFSSTILDALWANDQGFYGLP